MIREYYLTFVNNYVGLVLEGFFYKRKLLFVALLLLLSGSLLWLALWSTLLYCIIFIALIIYSALLTITPQRWRCNSRKLGLQSLIIYPGSTIWLKKMLRSRSISIPVQEKVIEIHVNTRQKYKNWDEYNAILDRDIDKIISHLKSGKFGSNVTVTFNSFNRRITDKLEIAFQGRGIRLKQVTLPDLIIYTYHPNHFKKVQKNMFGEVKSQRPVHVSEAWELLIYNYEGGTTSK